MTSIIPTLSQLSAASVLLAVTATSARTCLPPQVVGRGAGNRPRFLISNVGTKTVYFETGTQLGSAANALVAVVPTAPVKAAGTWTNDTSQPANGSTVTIGTKVYTFQTTLTDVDGHVKIGASATASTTNLFNAINGSGGTIGTDYATSTIPHTQVVATNPTATTVVATALVAGSLYNAVATTSSTSPNSHGTWGGLVLASGANNTGGTPLVTLGQIIITVPYGHDSIAAICGGSDTSTLFVTPG